MSKVELEIKIGQKFGLLPTSVIKNKLLNDMHEGYIQTPITTLLQGDQHQHFFTKSTFAGQRELTCPL